MSRNAPKAAAANTKIMVRMLPERIKAMTKKVMKKTLAVPRSFIKKSAPMQRAVNTRNTVRFRVVCSLFKVEAPVKIKAILMNSEG